MAVSSRGGEFTFEREEVAMKKQRKRSHIHALRAAAAVTGRARVLGAPLIVGLIGAQACSQGPEQDDPGWELESADMSAQESGVVDMRVVNASEDMQGVGGVADMRAAEPDMSPREVGADMFVAAPEDMARSVEDMGVDEPDMSIAAPDMMAATCLDDGGVTDWACCAEAGRDAQGCAFCSDPYVDPAQEPDCLSCWSLSLSGDFEGYNTCCQMFTDQEDSFRAGCSPWGPPAPTRYAGARIAELLAA